jgi:hypothetical protein
MKVNEGMEVWQENTPSISTDSLAAQGALQHST